MEALGEGFEAPDYEFEDEPVDEIDPYDDYDPYDDPYEGGGDYEYDNPYEDDYEEPDDPDATTVSPEIHDIEFDGDLEEIDADDEDREYFRSRLRSIGVDSYRGRRVAIKASLTPSELKDMIEPSFRDTSEAVKGLEKRLRDLESKEEVTRGEVREEYRKAIDRCDERLDRAKVDESVVEDLKNESRVRKFLRGKYGAIGKGLAVVAGIVTLAIVMGKKGISKVANTIWNLGQALLNLAKTALPLIPPLLNGLASLLGFMSKGASFIARNMWVLVLLATLILARYLGVIPRLGG